MSKKQKKKTLKLTGNMITVQSRCFRCDGSGSICLTCGETERACHCPVEDSVEGQNIGECPDCKGTGE